MSYEQIYPGIAFIRDGDAFFQVINEAGDDWDEAATADLYHKYQENKGEV